MSKLNYIIDAGHGGINPNTGEYVTAPNKMNVFDDGFTIYEGVFNRKVANKIYKRLGDHAINCNYITSSWEDMSLYDRVEQINRIGKECNGNVLVISIHGNYYHDSRAHGWQVHTYLGESKSDEYALYFLNSAVDKFTENQFKIRRESPDDPDWDNDFYILREHQYPAVLTENFFMSNRTNAEFMMSDKGQEWIADTHVDAILSIEK